MSALIYVLFLSIGFSCYGMSKEKLVPVSLSSSGSEEEELIDPRRDSVGNSSIEQKETEKLRVLKEEDNLLGVRMRVPIQHGNSQLRRDKRSGLAMSPPRNKALGSDQNDEALLAGTPTPPYHGDPKAIPKMLSSEERHPTLARANSSPMLRNKNKRKSSVPTPLKKRSDSRHTRKKKISNSLGQGFNFVRATSTGAMPAAEPLREAVDSSPMQDTELVEAIKKEKNSNSPDQGFNFVRAASTGRIPPWVSPPVSRARAVDSSPLKGTALVEAIKNVSMRGDIDKLEDLLKQQDEAGDMHDSLVSGSPLIFWAIENNRIALALLLNKFGIKDDCTDDQGRTPLMYSLSQKKDALYTLFLETCTNFHTTDPKGRTALHYAAENGLAEVIISLSKKAKFLMDVQDNDQLTPLMLAVRNNQLEACIMLLSCGADAVKLTDGNGKTALHHIAESKVCSTQTICAQITFTEVAQLNTKNAEGRTPLIAAFYKKNWEVVLWLFSQGIDQQGEESLAHLALREGYNEFFDLKLSCFLEEKDSSGLTPLMIATKRCDQILCIRLLKNGASLTTCNELGDTAFHIAAQSGNSALCILYCVHAADIDMRNELGETPLMCAVKAEHYHLVNLFIENGADPQCMSRFGQTLRSMSRFGQTLRNLVNGGNTHVEMPLCRFCKKEHGLTDESFESFICDVSQGRVANVRYHIDTNFRVVDTKDANGTPALVLAANNGHLEVVKLLVEYCVDKPAFKDARAKARKKGYTEIVKLLKK